MIKFQLSYLQVRAIAVLFLQITLLVIIKQLHSKNVSPTILKTLNYNKLKKYAVKCFRRWR